MADYVWPEDLVPYAVSFYLQPHTGGSESPFSRMTKVYGLSAPRWICSLSFRGGDSSQWGNHEVARYGPRLDALIAKLKGRQNRIALHDFRRDEMWEPWPVTASNVYTAAGATSMTVTGLTDGDTIYAGDYIGGDGRPHIITDDVVVSGGSAIVRFEPPLAMAVLEGIAVFGNPPGLFRLTSDDAGSNASQVGELAGYQLDFVEDPPAAEDIALWDVSLWATTMFQDSAATTPVTASGQLVGCIRNINGNTDLDLVQTDNAKRPTFEIIDELPQVICGIGTGLKSRATGTFPVNSLIIAAISGETSGAAPIGTLGFGFIVNASTYYTIGNTTLQRAMTTLRKDGEWLLASSAFYTFPNDRASVVDALVTQTHVHTRIDGVDAPGDDFSPLAHTQGGSDTFVSAIIGLNHVTTLVPASANAITFYGGAVVLGALDHRDDLVDYFVDRIAPDVRVTDHVLMITGDSITDDVVTATGAMGEELFLSWARNALVTAEPTKHIYYRNFNVYSQAFTGWELIAEGTGTDRYFISNLSVAGAQADYFLADRLAPFIAEAHPQVNEIIVSYGHNLAVNPVNDPAGYFRRGDFIEVSDELRGLYPTTPQMWIRHHPHRTTEVMASVVLAQDAVAAQYGDIEMVDVYAHFETNLRPVGWYHADNTHLTVPDGVAAQRVVFDPAYAAWAPGAVAAKLLGTSATNILLNGLFTSFAGAVPDNWTKVGAGTVTRETVIVDTELGDAASVKLTQTSGATYLQQTFDLTPYQSGQVTVAIREYSVAGSNALVGNITLESNGTGGIAADSSHSGKATGKFRWRFLTIPVPADATLGTLKLYCSTTGVATNYYGRAVLVSGAVPKNLT